MAGWSFPTELMVALESLGLHQRRNIDVGRLLGGDCWSSPGLALSIFIHTDGHARVLGPITKDYHNQKPPDEWRTGAVRKLFGPLCAHTWARCICSFVFYSHFVAQEQQTERRQVFWFPAVRPNTARPCFFSVVRALFLFLLGFISSFIVIIIIPVALFGLCLMLFFFMIRWLWSVRRFSAEWP